MYSEYGEVQPIEIINGFNFLDIDINTLSKEDLEYNLSLLFTVALKHPEKLFELGLKNLEIEQSTNIVQSEQGPVELYEYSMFLGIKMFKENQKAEPLNYNQLKMDLNKLIIEEED